MLEWLKNILGEAYTDEVDAKVSAEIGKNFVSKADFNQVNTAKKKAEDDVKARDQQLVDLQNATGDINAFKQQIADLQAQNAADKAAHEAEIARVRMENAVEAALTAAGAKNVTAAKALLADFLKDAKMADDGTVKGLTAEIESLAKAEGTSFMFEAASTQQPGFKGMTPGNPGGNTPPAGATYEARLAEARKTGNTAAAVAIKREAADNGVYLL